MTIINKSKLLPITYQTILRNAKNWLNIIRYGESGSIIQLQDDCEYRVLEIINNPKILKNILGNNYKKYLLVYTPIDQQDLLKSINDILLDLTLKNKIDSKKVLSTLTSFELLELLTKRGFKVGIFISHINSLFEKQNFQPLFDLELLIRTSKNLSVVLFSETDITFSKFNILVDKSSFLFDHIIKYPLYDEKDSRQFIAYYCHQWKFSLPEKIIKEIMDMWGGYFWLIHQACRSLRDNPDKAIQDAFSDDLMMKKLEIIWNKFTKEEKDIIEKVFFENMENVDKFTQIYNYLKSIRVIKEIDGKVKLGIPLLSKIIEAELRINTFQFKGKQILIGNKDITSKLTKKEKIMMLILLHSKDKLISRDVIARAVWEDKWHEKYSNWAIDRLVYRIRKKLRSIGIKDELLRTVKKKGFIFG